MVESVVEAYCTIWGSWMSVRLFMRAWLRQASSFRRLSLCCSIILFSSSIVFRLHSMDEICFRVQRQKKNKDACQTLASRDLELPVPGEELVGVKPYLGLELHHVCFYLHVGLIQFLDFMIQVLDVVCVVNAWVTTENLSRSNCKYPCCCWYCKHFTDLRWINNVSHLSHCACTMYEQYIDV